MSALKLRERFPLQRDQKVIRLRQTGGKHHADLADHLESISLRNTLRYSREMFEMFMGRKSWYTPDSTQGISNAASADKWSKRFLISFLAIRLPK